MGRSMQETLWHIGYVAPKYGRRHKARCIHFRSEDFCALHKKCLGSSDCKEYIEVSKKRGKNRSRNLDETYHPKNKSATHRIKNIRNDKPNKESAKGAENRVKNTSLGKAAKKLTVKGIKVGDIVELYDPMDGFRMRVHIVEKDKVDLKENKISEGSPIGKAVIGKEKGDKVEIFTNEKVVYEIVEWIKQ